MTRAWGRALIIGLLAPTPAVAASCLTHSEARAIYGYGLRWKGDGKGNRCWGVAFRTQKIIPKRNPPPDPPPVQIAKDAEPLHWVFEQTPVQADFTPRVQNSCEFCTPVYSTFAPGAEPDVWPVLEQPSSATPFLLVLFATLLAAGYWFWRMPDKLAWDQYAGRRGRAHRIAGSRSLARHVEAAAAEYLRRRTTPPPR